jgi:C-terminal processing protease CtpA/Prc
MKRIAIAVIALLALTITGRAQGQRAQSKQITQLEQLSEPPIHETSGTLFENVAKVLARYYVDEKFRKEQLPALVEQYRPRAASATSFRGQCEVVEELLSHIPASHLGLLSGMAQRTMMADLFQAPFPTFGFQVIGSGPTAYAGTILEGGPAARAGLLLGDRLVAIDGTLIEESPRVDWRTDDAYIGDERDPSVRYVLAFHGDGDRITLRIERHPGEFVDIGIAADAYSAFKAAEASVRVVRTGDTSIGYLHFWYVHIAGVPDLIKHAVEGPLKGVDALVIDLRGRGGSAAEVPRIIAAVENYRKRTGRPVVALADRQSRSAKDILTYEFKQRGIRIVGEASAGAVMPASFADVGSDYVLMFPATRLPKYSDLLELKPVKPDVPAERATVFAAGRDPILDAGLAEARRLAKPKK